mgnify:CR=1 FL=1
MPIKTQMRLKQLTGSLDDTGTEASSLNVGSLQEVLDAVAAGVKRITGGSNFHSAKAGSFTHSKMEITGSELEFDSTSANATIITKNASSPLRLQSEGNQGFLFRSQANANRALKVNGDNSNNIEVRPIADQADLIFGSTNAGSLREVFRIDGSADSNAGSILMNTTKGIEFGTADAKILRGSSDGDLDITGTGAIKAKIGGSTILEVGSAVTASTAVVSDTDYAQDLGSANLHWGELFVGQVNATGLTGSLRDTSISANQVAFANAQNTLVGDADFTWDGTALTLGGQSEGTTQLSVSGDAVITGDLTVNGTTTTVNSTNMTVDDAIILLGQGNNANTKDLGLVLERGGSNIALFLDETDDVFKFQFTTETAADDEITATDGKLTVQVDKLQITGSNSYIELADAGGGETLNIVSNRDINIDADNGKIYFTDSSVQTTDGVAVEFDLGTDQELSVKSGDSGSTFFKLDSANTRTLFQSEARFNTNEKLSFRDGDASLASATTAGELVYSGSSMVFANTTISNSGLIKIKKGTAAVGFDFDGTADVTYSWPNAPASNGYVLQAQTDGTLSWAAQGGAANANKVAQTIAATVSAGTDASSDGGFAAVDTQAIDATTAPNALDVFVNGQLLVSSSVAYASLGSASAGDYAISTAGVNNTDLKFTFDLEADDVITVIVRA